LEKMLERFQRQVGALRAVQPNAGGRNELRIKSVLQERRETAQLLKDLEAAFPDTEERKFLEQTFRVEFGL